MLDIIAATRNDFLFSSNGDFTVKGGDLETSQKIKGLGFIEEVELRIKSSPGDWYFDLRKGADLESFEGRMITPSLIQGIKEAIKSSLTYDDFLTKSDFRVDATAIDIGEIAIKVVFSTNIIKYVDYKIQDVRIVFDLNSGASRIMRN
jgi:hypothetical protein